MREREEDSRVIGVKSVGDMIELLHDKGRPLSAFKKGDIIYVWNKMQKGYSYELKEAPGDTASFAEGFQPYATPGEILALGAFGGKYLNDCVLEYPAEWFWNAILLEKLCPEAPAGGKPKEINYFKIDSRLPLGEWQKKGWVPKGGRVGSGILGDASKNPDERGWFQWYCRYWMGRRIPDLDAVQIQRWKNFRRHYGAVKKGCAAGDVGCRPRQRQALLHWAWPFRD